ncbi:type II toxin-antitoxin system VapB family antitoxin [Sphingomonas sp. ZT3P38]|uniref:type II toxin-antitoxin system VapB family antitoxin n=1 Tax=Parasphingomonas zepuensis TaxID=3096161 RepID=UPI002FCC1A88
MTISIRDPQADALARRLAQIDGTSIADAVVTALREAIDTRMRRETASETAGKILARHGLSFRPDRAPVPAGAYHDLDEDLASIRGARTDQ